MNNIQDPNPHWEIFAALADRHVTYFGAGDQEGHVEAFCGDCDVCLPALAALRELGWNCDRDLAARLDNINDLAARLAAVRHMSRDLAAGASA